MLEYRRGCDTNAIPYHLDSKQFTRNGSLAIGVQYPITSVWNVSLPQSQKKRYDIKAYVRVKIVNVVVENRSDELDPGARPIGHRAHMERSRRLEPARESGSS